MTGAEKKFGPTRAAARKKKKEYRKPSRRKSIAAENQLISSFADRDDESFFLSFFPAAFFVLFGPFTDEMFGRAPSVPAPRHRPE